MALYVAKTPTVTNKFASLHNHPGNGPQSSGDIYGFIDMVTNNSSFETNYVVTSDGTVYALIITDLTAAKKFNTDYPSVPGVNGYEPTFPEAVSSEYYDIIQQQKGLYEKTPQEANEIAITYILSKYKAGVALLKQDTDGNFKRLNTEYNSNGNNNPYTIKKCQ